MTLEQARAQAVQAVADAVADKLPALAKSERQRCTLDVFLTDHYGPWARAELRRGDRYVHRIRTALPGALEKTGTEVVNPGRLPKLGGAGRAPAVLGRV